MPNYLKKGDPRAQPGHYDNPATFYNVAQSQSGTGAVVRNKTLAWTAFVNVAPYQGLELRDALREIGETWATISLQYVPSRQPKEGMRIVLTITQEEYEIRGVEHLSMARHKVELTCRLVR